MSSKIEIVGFAGGEGAFVRGVDDASCEREEWSGAPLRELRRLRTEALQAASNLRDDVTKVLRECEIYLSSATELLDRSLFVGILAKKGTSDSLTEYNHESHAELKSRAARYHRIANEKGRWANAQMGKAVSLESKASGLAVAIRRLASSESLKGI